MKQLRYIGAVVIALSMFTACEKEFDVIPETIATVPEDSPEAWQQTVTIKELIMLPLGQVVAIRCNGLILGRYAGAPQLGVRGYRNDNKVREEPGRIPYTLAMTRIQKIGNPDPSKIVIEEMTLKQITELDKYGYFKIVKIKNAYFTGYDSDGEKLGDEVIPFPTDGPASTISGSPVRAR